MFISQVGFGLYFDDDVTFLYQNHYTKKLKLDSLVFKKEINSFIQIIYIQKSFKTEILLDLKVRGRIKIAFKNNLKKTNYLKFY